MNTTTKIALALALSIALAGCIGFGDDEETEAAGQTGGIEGVDVGQQTQQDIEERTQEPTNFTMPGQEALETETVIFEGSVGPQSNLAHESKNDRAGNDVNTYRVTEDVSDHIPVGQPTEMHVKLHYQGSAGSSADLDIYVNVPGTETEYAPDNNDEWNWKLTVQTMTVNTIGVQGEDHVVGVEVTNGKMVSSMDYTLNVTFRYAEDVITPYHPYAIEVPQNASGLIFESVKTGGDEHIDSDILVIGPDDDLVRHVAYNDLAIASESVLVPVEQPGEHVVYTPHMRGGFLSVSADEPPQQREAQVLAREPIENPVLSGPAPGTVEHNPTEGCTGAFVGNCDAGVSTPLSGGQQVDFTIEETFPLEISAWVGDDESFRATAGSQVRISSDAGVVHDYKRVMRSGSGEDQVGMTRDEINTAFNPGNLTRGQYTAHIVNNGPGEVGYSVLTYSR